MERYFSIVVAGTVPPFTLYTIDTHPGVDGGLVPAPM